MSKWVSWWVRDKVRRWSDFGLKTHILTKVCHKIDPQWSDKNMFLPLPGSFWKWNKVEWSAKISRGENTNFTLKWNSDNCVNIVPAPWFLPCRFCSKFNPANHSQRNQFMMIDNLQNIWNIVFVLAFSSCCNPSLPITRQFDVNNLGYRQCSHPPTLLCISCKSMGQSKCPNVEHNRGNF